MSEANYTIQHAIADVQKGITLTGQQAELVFNQIMQGQATPGQIGALLMGLSIRGETPIWLPEQRVPCVVPPP